jgi:hypothetical protein
MGLIYIENFMGISNVAQRSSVVRGKVCAVIGRLVKLCKTAHMLFFIEPSSCRRFIAE